MWIENIFFPQPMLNFLKKPILGITPIMDYWLVVHFMSGVILSYILGPNQGSLVMSLLIGYELFEMYLLNKGVGFKEPFINQILDVIAGYIGYTMLF